MMSAKEKQEEKKKKANEDTSIFTATNESDNNSITKNSNKEMKQSGEEIIHGLPHEQVPQPSDFSTEALENLLI
ncbi:hypothetical protein BVRB_8g197160 [Beta vulgaris subsp. vulgaris]|nr:hypothetical protein BVRB_8g197160 [Beta vulgaris subsp. vulgaris]